MDPRLDPLRSQYARPGHLEYLYIRELQNLSRKHSSVLAATVSVVYSLDTGDKPQQLHQPSPLHYDIISYTQKVSSFRGTYRMATVVLVHCESGARSCAT